jgi:hypothetical protein
VSAGVFAQFTARNVSLTVLTIPTATIGYLDEIGGRRSR